MLEIATVFLGIILAQVTPGPNMMAVASASLGTSRRSGLATAAGVATGVFIWAILFAFGIGTILRTFPETVTVMRFVGGGYLVFLGFKALRSALGPAGNGRVEKASAMAGPAAYRRGLLVVMTNPKAALMWVAVSMFLASSHVDGLRFLLIGLGASVSAMTVYGTYAFLFSTGVAVRAYKRLFRIAEGTFGILFGIAGGKLVLDGVRALRS